MNNLSLRTIGHATLLTLAALAPLSAAKAAVLLSENFDGVVTPALPSGWTNTDAAGANPWVTNPGSGVGGTNSAFVREPNSVADSRLTSPVVSFAGASNAILSFQNSYNTELNFDGGVLEASLNGGAFADILALGGSFLSGGYVSSISVSFQSPILGRQAWNGSSGGYLTTTVDLPASFDGQNAQFRWRFATDTSVSGSGWNIDSIAVTADSAAVPVPAPLALLGIGFVAAAVRRRKQ